MILHPLNNNGLGEAIRKPRESMGYTQSQLAEKAGLSTVYIGFLETGRRGHKPTIEGMAALAKALDCNTTDLIGEAR